MLQRMKRKERKVLLYFGPYCTKPSNSS